MNPRLRSGTERALPLWLEVLVGGFILGVSTTAVYRVLAAQSSAHVMRAPWWMNTSLDHFVPFIPVSVWVYASWYFCVPLLLFTDRQTVRRGFLGFALAFLVCSLGHALWPVTIARPDVDADLGLSVGFLRWFYAFDPPHNVFPSFHAAGAALVVALRPQRPLVLAWGIAVSVSCVLIRQHFVLDVLVGFPIGIGCAWCAKRAVVGTEVEETVVHERTANSGTDFQLVDESSSAGPFG